MRFFFVLWLLISIVQAKPYNEIALKKIANTPVKERYCFAVMGDNRDGEEVFKKILKDIEKKDYLFAINNGDLVSYGFRYQFREYVDMIKHLQTPFVSVIGNHDIPFFGGRGNFRNYIGKPYFSFVYGESYFIVLDNANKRRIEGKELHWLKKQLKIAKQYKYRFVFLHVPLFDPRKGKRKKGHSMKDGKNANLLNKLFDKYNITMVFASHIHSYFRGKWKKTPFIITGGAGAPQSWDKGQPHYIKVCIDKKKVFYHMSHLQIIKSNPQFKLN